jgi:hypothetical protein
MDAPDDSNFDYDTLQLTDNLIGEVYQSVQQHLCDTVKEAELSRLESRIHQTQSALTERNQQLSSVRLLYEERREQLIERLMQIQRREWESLEERLSGEMPPKFRKVSQELLVIRKREKTLRLTQRFMEAKQMRKDGDAKEAVEQEANLLRWHKYGDKLREELKRKHELQMECLNERLSHEWEVLEPVSKAQQSHCKKAIEHQERRKMEVQNSANDFRTQTTRDVQNAKREQWPQLTARRVLGSGTSSPVRKGQGDCK